MTIQIDDSGWGDLLGGVLLGLYRRESEQFVYRIIGVEYFQDPLFDRKMYLSEASILIQDALNEEFTNPQQDSILLCRGYILSQAAVDLRAVGYNATRNVTRGKITGPLQKLVEAAFTAELKKMGYESLSDRESSVAMRRKSFYYMLKWMKADPERRKFAKTGWSFFNPVKREAKRRRWRTGEE